MNESVIEPELPRLNWENIVRNDHPMVPRDGPVLVVSDCVLVGDCWDFTGTGVQRVTFSNCRLEKPITMVFPEGFHGALFEGLTLNSARQDVQTDPAAANVTIRIPNRVDELDIRGIEAFTWRIEANTIANCRLSGTFANIEVSSGQFHKLEAVKLSAAKLQFGNCSFGQMMTIREVKIGHIYFGESGFPANVILENIAANDGEASCELLLSPGGYIRNSFLISQCKFSALVIRGTRVAASGTLRIEEVNCNSTFDWSALVFEPGGRLSFLRTPLADSLCIGTQIDTNNITFGPGCWVASRAGTRLAGDRIANASLAKLVELRPAIHNREAIQIERQETIQHTLLNYSALLKHHEDRREFALAELFHVGEMEMMRLRRATSAIYLVSWYQKNISFIGLYRLCSLYGSSYGRALCVMAGMIIVLAFFFMGNGVSCYPEGAACNGFKYSFTLGGGPAAAGVIDVLHDCWRSLVYVVEVAALQKDPTFLPTTSLGRLVRALVPVVIAGQIALLIFALRRNFRRTSSL